MIITREISLRDFEPWSGAVSTYEACPWKNLTNWKANLSFNTPMALTKRS